MIRSARRSANSHTIAADVPSCERRPLGRDPADVAPSQSAMVASSKATGQASNQMVKSTLMAWGCLSDLPRLIIIRPHKPQASFAARLAVLCFLAVDHGVLAAVWQRDGVCRAAC